MTDQVLFQLGGRDVLHLSGACVGHPLQPVPHVDVRASPLINLGARSTVDLVQRPEKKEDGYVTMGEYVSKKALQTYRLPHL